MNRLTGRMENNDPYYPHCYESNCDSNCASCDFDYEVLEKLTAYEDLEEKLKKVYGECDGLLEVVVNGLVKHEGVEIGKPKKARLLTDEDVDKWEDLKNAEEQELLLRLPAPLDDVESFEIADKGIWMKIPCRKGDTVYEIDGITWKGHDWKYRSYKNAFVKETVFRLEMLSEIEKTVFLTKEEAEQALARMEGNNG